MWPEYNTRGDVLNRYWHRLDTERAAFQFVLVDGAELIAQGHTVPVAWDGTVAGLPKGIDGAIEGAFEGDDEATALCALAAEIPPRHQRRGLSRLMIEAMAGIAGAHGLGHLIAPVRPSWKERYPLVPIEEYARWRRGDGQHLDPWIRVHERLGGEILAPEPESLRITGTVADWEEWTGMAFPVSGRYWFPRGLALLDVSRQDDLGAYWEPNVWMRHPVSKG